MNSLSNTQVFQQIDKIMNIKNILTNTNLTEYFVDVKMYEHYLKIFKGYKYTLSRAVVDEASKGTVRLVMFTEPSNVETKKLLNVPTALFSFVSKNGDKLITISDISSRASYVRNKVDGTIELFKVDEHDLYVFLQSALTNYIINTKKNALINSIKFAKITSEIYAMLLSKCIDRTYPIGSERSPYIILNFLCASFMLQTMFGYTPEKATQVALTLRTVDKVVIANECHSLNDDGKMSSVEDLIALIEKEFNFIKKGSITYRNLNYSYNKMYGQNSVFAIEHFFSFINMLQMANMRSRMFNDMSIDNIAKKYTEEINVILLDMVNIH